MLHISRLSSRNVITAQIRYSGWNNLTHRWIVDRLICAVPFLFEYFDWLVGAACTFYNVFPKTRCFLFLASGYLPQWPICFNCFLKVVLRINPCIRGARLVLSVDPWFGSTCLDLTGMILELVKNDLKSLASPRYEVRRRSRNRLLILKHIQLSQNTLLCHLLRWLKLLCHLLYLICRWSRCSVRTLWFTVIR
jgi:hypothetical protein